MICTRATLFHLNIAGVTSKEEEYAFAAYIDIIESLNRLDIILSHFCLRSAIEGEMDLTLSINFISLVTIDIREWYGLVSFAPVRLIHHIVRSNHSLQLLYP